MRPEEEGPHHGAQQRARSDETTAGRTEDYRKGTEGDHRSEVGLGNEARALVGA